MVSHCYRANVPQAQGNIVHRRCNLQSRLTSRVKNVLECVSLQDQLCGLGVSIAAASLLLLVPAAQAQEINNRCEPNSSCVSPSAWKSPAQYMPAWSFYPSSRAAAFRQAQVVMQDLETDGRATILEQDPEAGYFKARLQFSLASKPDFDIAEVWLRDDGIATFRVQSEINLPSPPGCLRKNCINGPRTRQHATWLQDQLGWLPLETDEGKDWKPLFFH